MFCASAFTWQAMKIYLDVWLKDWTDIEQAKRFTDVCIILTLVFSIHFAVALCISISFWGFELSVLSNATRNVYTDSTLPAP